MTESRTEMTHKWIFYSQRHPWMMNTAGHYQKWIKSQNGAGPAQWIASLSLPLQSKWHKVAEHISMKGWTIALENGATAEPYVVTREPFLTSQSYMQPSCKASVVGSHSSRIGATGSSSVLIRHESQMKRKDITDCFKMDLGVWVQLHDTQQLLPVKPTGIMQSRTQKHQLLRPTGARVSEERRAFRESLCMPIASNSQKIGVPSMKYV